MLPTSEPQRHLEARLTQLIRVCSVQQRPGYDHATNAEGGNRLSPSAALRSLPGQAALQWRDLDSLTAGWYANYWEPLEKFLV